MKYRTFLIAGILSIMAVSASGSAACQAVQVHPGPCPEDFDGDGNVGAGDLLRLLSCWGPVSVPECEPANLVDVINCDNVRNNSVNEVTAIDLLQLLSKWGTCS